MPDGLKLIIYIALGAIAVKQIFDVVWTRQIRRELTENGGNSTKDQIRRAADDSREALDLIKSRGEEWERTTTSLNELKGDVKALSDRQDEQWKAFDKIKTDLARYIVHEANNDLNISSLVEEEKKFLAEQEARKAGIVPTTPEGKG